jgi:DNA end-binding protein Ku
VRNPRDELDSLPRRGVAKKAELAMAHQLIDSMSGSWKPADFHDTYTERVQKLIKAKKKGKAVTVAEPAPEPTGVSDLLEVLRRSVDEASKRRGSPPAAKKQPPKKTPAKKRTPAKKTAKKTARKAARKAA